MSALLLPTTGPARLALPDAREKSEVGAHRRAASTSTRPADARPLAQRRALVAEHEGEESHQHEAALVHGGHVGGVEPGGRAYDAPASRRSAANRRPDGRASSSRMEKWSCTGSGRY